jgi:HPt (histidine-containing phosphotransfer) domain-containing protein
METVEAKLLPRKYLPIVYAVAFFVVFDLGVLVLNFYTSYQISEDAVAINLAGRQRMLSQRMTKAILTLNEDLQVDTDAASTFKELQTTVGLFDGTLKAFYQGGQATGSDGKPASLQAIESEQGREILSQAQQIWDPYREALQPLLKGDLALDTAAVIGVLPAAMVVARENNLKLLDLMNRLTTHLEQFAKQKADRLRLVQTIGITLALINFGFILFHFLRQLRDGDQRIEAARRETTEILDTVNEGLFLLGADGRIGNQFSASLPRVLHREIKPGEDFFALLKSMAPEDTVQIAKRYIDLLFSGRVRERLVDDLNPLSRFEIQMETPSGGYESRYLDMQFNRAIVGARISHLLVTVTDITERVRLEQELAAAGRMAKTESEMLVSILHIEPAELLQFLDSTEKTLLEINEQLKHKSGGPVDCLRTVQSVFRSVHAVKGEAAALGLESMELLAHQFEQELVVLRERDRLSGNDLLSLPIHLKALFERIDLIRGVMQRAAGFRRVVSDAGSAPDGLTAEIQRLAARVAETQRKQVRVAAELAGFDGLPEAVRGALKDMAFQLIRNAVYHGIEAPEERARVDKPLEGTIRITLRPVGSGRFEFIVRDDGRGLVPQHIREALLASGRHRIEDVNALDERTLLSKIFEPGFSTAAQNADCDAGRGVGLDLVKTNIVALRAQLKLDTQPGQFTEFRIQFAA